MRILVVAEDAVLANSLIRALRRYGYDSDGVNTGTEALATHRQVDLVLLDLELADLDGLEVCRAIRADCGVPIIAVTTRDNELDRVLALQAGSDDCMAKEDFLVKSYGSRELTARIEAIMRRVRPQPTTNQIISHGPLKINTGTREVHLNNRLISVTRKEFDLLYLLMSQPDVIISRNEIMFKVWDCDLKASTRTIDTHVNSLRTKLGASGWIITVRGVGYRIGQG